MQPQDYELPSNAPNELVKLLLNWKQIWSVHPPTLSDLSFDELVVTNPGLFIVDPRQQSDGSINPIFVRAGPECKKRIRSDIEGLDYSTAINSSVLSRVNRIYPEILSTGVPHYWEIANALYGAPPQHYHRLLFPIYNEKGVASQLMGSCVWLDDDV